VVSDQWTDEGRMTNDEWQAFSLICHPERSEGSLSRMVEILRFAQNDKLNGYRRMLFVLRLSSYAMCLTTNL